MQDHSDIERKLYIRHKAISRLSSIQKVADCYAGDGIIAMQFWKANANKVLCIEKDKKKAKSIVGENIDVVVGDNRNCIYMIRDCDVIDCDAYGLVMPFIAKIQSFGIRDRLVIFTDGTPKKALRVCRATSDFFLSANGVLRDVVIERSEGGMAYFGYGWIK